MKRHSGLVAAVVFLSVLYVPLANATQIRTYPSQIDRYAVSDPATLVVRFHVYNDGTQSVAPSCTITGQDISGAYHGFDVVVLKPIPAGTTLNSIGTIVITNQGASYVTQVKIVCTAQTSDTGTISGNITVLRVDPPTSDGFAGHDSSGWFWGGIAILSGVPDNAEVKCTLRALDATGHVLATYTFDGQAYQGAVSGLEEQNTTSAIGPKIKSADASCQLGNGDVTVPVTGSSTPATAPTQAANTSSWYPDGFEEVSPGFAWKWNDNPVNCVGDEQNNECWNGQLIVKEGCPHGVILKVGLYNDKSKSAVSTFTQKYYANFLPSTGVILSINHTANKQAPSAQIDAEACMTAKEGGNNPVPPKNVPINTYYNDIATVQGDTALGSDFYVGAKIIKCSESKYAICYNLDVVNTVYCSKGYTFSGFVANVGKKKGWLPISPISVNRSRNSQGVGAGFELAREMDVLMSSLPEQTGLSIAAIQAQLKLPNMVVINSATCFN